MGVRNWSDPCSSEITDIAAVVIGGSGGSMYAPRSMAFPLINSSATVSTKFGSYEN